MRNMKCACIVGSKGTVMSSKMSGSKNIFWCEISVCCSGVTEDPRLLGRYALSVNT